MRLVPTWWLIALIGSSGCGGATAGAPSTAGSGATASTSGAIASATGSAGTSSGSTAGGTSSASSSGGAASGGAVRVACGQNADITDADRAVWQTDADFTGGTPYLNAGQAVTGTDTPALYDGQRFGASGAAFSYDFAVAPGAYTVLLKFTENAVTAAGQRIFNVAINGVSVLSDFDIYGAAGGQWIAVDRSFSVTVGEGQGLSVTFAPGAANNPKVDAIAVLPSAGTSASTTANSNSAGTASSATTSGATSTGSSGGTTGSSPRGVFGVSVSGNQFVSTLDGGVIQFLGTSVSTLEIGCTSFSNGIENYGNAADPGFAAMASWNMNYVRIPLNEDTWLGKHGCQSICGDNGTTSDLQANLKQAVANANDAGLYVDLDLHWAAPDSYGCPTGQGSMPDSDNTVAFWTSVAVAFKDNPAVVFELFNEPFGTNSYDNWVESPSGSAPPGQSAPDESILANGGTYFADAGGYWFQCNNGCNLTGGTEYPSGVAPFQTAGYQQLIDAIRATGATNVILANPIGWAGQIQTWLPMQLHDPIGQLAAGWHEDGTGTSDAQVVLSAGFPIVITEAYDMNFFSWATSNQVGFSYWAWVDWSGGGLLTNAQSHAPSATGVTLKTAYCTQSKLNSLAQCP